MFKLSSIAFLHENQNKHKKKQRKDYQNIKNTYKPHNKCKMRERGNFTRKIKPRHKTVDIRSSVGTRDLNRRQGKKKPDFWQHSYFGKSSEKANK